MTWAKKRQFAYLGGLVAFIILFILLPGYFLLREEPTCFDGEKNGEELGVDCGGPCSKVCEFQAVDPVISWDESFETREGLWSVAAYIENPNNAEVESAPYKFRLLDSEGVLVAEKVGVTYVPPKQRFLVFESRIEVGNRVPTQEFFEFEEGSLEWQRADSTKQPLDVKNTSVEVVGSNTRLSADINNPTTTDYENISVAGIIYDIDGNAINISQSFIEELRAGEEQRVTFTWPRVFDRDITKKEVLYVILPD